MDKAELQKKREKRFQFLNKLYDLQEENPRRYISTHEIGEELGFDRYTSESIVEYLSGEKLIRRLTHEGGISIEHRGKIEVEEAIENPTKPTEHFPAIQNNYYNNAPVYGAQQGTSNSTQTNNITVGDTQSLKEIISQLISIKEHLDLPSEARQELESDIDTLKAQVASPKPKSSIVGETLKSIRTTLGKATSKLATHTASQAVKVAAPEVMGKIDKWFEQLQQSL